MKLNYILIAPIYQMNIFTIHNVELKIGNQTCITNNVDNIKSLLENGRFFLDNNPSLLMEMENHEAYFKYEGELYYELYDENKSRMVYDFLEETQSFLNTLWLIKDHGSYVRNGYIFIYSDITKEMDNYYYKELNQVISLADGSSNIRDFSMDEIQLGISLFSKELNKFPYYKYEGCNKVEWHFYKSNAEDRANYFLLAARSNTVLPIKLFFYCSLLELLFSIDSSENKLKIAERVAVSIGTDKDDILTIYRTIKRAFEESSKLIHGSLLNQRALSYLTVSLDSISRKVFNSEIMHKLQHFRLKEFNEYFLSCLSD